MAGFVSKGRKWVAAGRVRRGASRHLRLASLMVFFLFMTARASSVTAVPTLVTFNVNSTLDEIDDDISDGLCRTAAGTCTLRAAVMQANAISGEGAQVNLPDGTYTLTRPAAGNNGPDSGDLNLTTPTNGDPIIRIAGANTTATIIDANGLDRAFAVDGNRTAALINVTIANGYRENPTGPAEGGAIVNLGRLTVLASVIRDNTATGLKAEGGGIANGGELTVMESEIAGNSAEGESAWGGGLYNFGTLDVFDTVVEGNWTAGNSNNFFGGGIANDGDASVLTVAGSDIRDNTASYGGGIFSALGHLILTGSRVSDNTAAVGGGIYLDLSSANIADSTINGNSAPDAGGIYSSATTVLARSTISDNGGDGPFAEGGGFINREGGVLTIVTSTVSGNASRTAGGIYNAGDLFVVNSTISLNNAYDMGGGIYNDGAANVYNTTIFANQADADVDFAGDAGGVFSREGAEFNLRNTLLAGNYRSAAPDFDECGGFINAYGLNLIGIETLDGDSVSCDVNVEFGTWTLLNDLDTVGDLQDNGGPTETHALLDFSNAIDGGDPINGCVDYNSEPLVIDQRGAPRVAGDVCDVGAYEYGAEVPVEEYVVYLPVVIR